MKLSLPLLVLASSVLATPTPKTHSERSQARQLQRRSGRASGMGRPFKPANSKTTARSSSSSVTYSENWAGAVYASPPSGETFSAVSASFIVPTPSAPSDTESTDGEYSAAIWVGIDGYTYSTAILQTGIDVSVSTNGQVSYEAWYEWYPDVSEDFHNIQISAGDNITASVEATSSTTGTATIENVTTGQTATITLSSTYELEGQNAEWIVEDYDEDDSLVALADFGDVTFVNCVATTSSSSEGIEDAMVMELESTSGSIEATVTFTNDTSFLVSYDASGASANSTGTGTSLGGLRGDSTSSTSNASRQPLPSGLIGGLLAELTFWTVFSVLAW